MPQHGGNTCCPASLMVLDSPATANAVTYMLSAAPTVAATVSGTPTQPRRRRRRSRSTRFGDDRCIGLVQRQTSALATTVSMAATTIWPRPTTSPAPTPAWRSRRPGASYAPGSIGSAADKSGAAPKPSLPRSRARAKSVHGVSH
jgi:hypothetical protein